MSTPSSDSFACLGGMSNDSLASLDGMSNGDAVTPPPSIPEIQPELASSDRAPATDSGIPEADSGFLMGAPIISRKERRKIRSSSLSLPKKDQQINDSDREPGSLAFLNSDSTSPRFNVARRAKWLSEDDAKLREAYAHIMKQKLGCWREVAQLAFPQGEFSMQSCIARWRTLSLPDHFTGPWTAGEDATLKHAVDKHGTTDWMLIESQMSRRTSKQCRER